MQPLDPLTVCGIGLPVSPRHLRQLPRGHHQDFAPHRFQHLVRRDPVDPCSPSPPTPRHGLAATSPCGSIPPWWLRNRLFPGLFLPPWERTPNVVRSPDQRQPRCGEPPATLRFVFYCLYHPCDCPASGSAFPSTSAQVGVTWNLA